MYLHDVSCKLNLNSNFPIHLNRFIMEKLSKIMFLLLNVFTNKMIGIAEEL